MDDTRKSLTFSQDESQNEIIHSQLEESQLESQLVTQLESQLESQLETQLESESIKHQIPPLYGVYLLNSLSKKSCFYVGSTPDPVRRLRQHNGELSCGGAYRTKKQGYRPWRMILYVYGFPTKISALQFEHAWQHAYQTRHIPFERRLNPGKRQTGSGTSIHSKIANCRLLLTSPSFKRLGLKIAIFNSSVYDAWLKNRYGIEVPLEFQLDVRINTEKLDELAIMGGNYNQLKDFMESNISYQKAYFKKCVEVISNEELLNVCEICKRNVTVNDGLDTLCVCAYKDCKCVYHLDCLANKFINDENDKETDHIIPKHGKCLQCKKMNFWNLIIRGTSYLQSYKS